MYTFLKVVLIISVTNVALSARILCVYPTPSYSHQVVFRQLTHELARRGHEVVVVTPDPALPKGTLKGNITEIDVHDYSYDKFINVLKNVDVSNRGEKATDFFDLMNNFYGMMYDVGEYQLNAPKMKNILNNKNEHFDVVIIEAFLPANCFLAHKFNAPLIGFVSMQPMADTYEYLGAPIHPLLYPEFYQKKLNLTFWEKVKTLYNSYKIRTFFENEKTKENKYIEKFIGEGVLNIDECKRLMDLLLVNDNSIWTGARPLPPNIVNVGGMHTVKDVKPLPEDLRSYLDNCTEGVVYMSFGSNVKSSEMKPDKIKIFLNAFASLPFKVLWKWETDELQGKPDNVRIAKWLPQSDLLRHPNIKLFITQGGLQSTDEAIAARVPLLGIPFFADQELNVQRYIQHGVGLSLNFETITEDQLRDTILEVINDKKYKQNMERISALMSDEPLPPLERAVWWTEYVIRHKGARHLRPPSAGLSFAQYYMLDLLALCAGAALAALAALWIIVKALVTVARNHLGTKRKDGQKCE